MTTAAGETATKTATLINDADGDGVADPGDTLRYTVTVANGSSVDMNNAAYSDTIDSNTTLVSGSVKVLPRAVDDSYAVATGATLNKSAAGGVLSNDIGSPALSVTAVNGSAANVGAPISLVGGGTLTLNADGSFSYIAPGSTGSDSFTYAADNGSGASTATVTISVQAAPVAVDDGPSGTSAPGDPYHTAVDTPLNSSSAPAYSVLDNDTGNPGLTVTSFGPSTGAETAAGSAGASAQGGTLTVNSNGEFTYNPPSGFIGYDTFRYTMQNGLGSDTATVTIAVGERPSAVVDSYSVIATGSLNIAALSGVLNNDTGSPILTVTQVNGSAANVGVPIPVGGGNLTLNADGSFSYAAPPATGSAAFTYQASNALGGSTATVTITVTPGPTANDDGPAGGSNSGDPYHTGLNTAITGPTAYSVLDNDTGTTPLSVTTYGVLGSEVAPGAATPTSQGGSVTLNAAGNIVSYTPPGPTFIGTDTFKYTMTSSVGGSASATVTIKVGSPANAGADSYDVYGNIGISIAAPGPLSNDTGDSISLQSYGSGTLPGNNYTTANGGTFNMASSGAFTYNPAAGYTGTDTVSYIISNSAGSSTGTITFTISNMIWFIDNSAPAGDGRWGTPFNSLAAFNAVNDGAGLHPKNGDLIYVFTGGAAYTGGTTLRDSQQLIGAGSNLSAILGSLPTGSPAMPAAGAKPNIGNSGGVGVTIALNNTIRGLDIGASGGTARSGVMRASGSVGNLTVLDSVTASATNGPAFSITSGGTLDATFASLSSTSSGTQGVRLENSGGSFTVTGTTNVTNSIGAGVSLVNNSASVSLGTLNITNTSTNALGVNASGSTGTIASSSGAINTGSGQAVNINGGLVTTPLNMTLTSVSSVNGGAPGISIQKTSGSFTVAGSGSTNSGGSISAKSGDTNGVYLVNASNVSLNWMTISGNTQNGVYGQSVDGFVLGNSTVMNNGNSIGTGIDESGLYFVDLSGTAPGGSSPTSILSSNISSNYRHNLYLHNNTEALTELQVDNSDLNNTPAGGTCPPGCGKAGVFAEAANTSSVGVNVVNSRINNNALDGIQATCTNSASMNVTVTGSQVSGDNIPINLVGANACAMTFDISDNPGLTNFTSTGINVSNSGSATATGYIRNNTIRGNLPVVNGFGVRIQGDDSSTITALIDSNTISDTAYSGIDVGTTIDGAPHLNLNITNNQVTVPNSPVGQGYNAIFVEADHSGTDLCVDLFNNMATALAGPGYFGIELDQFTGSTVRLERLGGSSTTSAAAVQTYLDGNNTLTPPSFVWIDNSIQAVTDGTCTEPTFVGASPLRFARMVHATSAATGPQAVAAPPQHVSRVPALSGETISQPIGNIPAGKSVTIIFDVTIDTSIPATTTSVSNQGTVTWTGGSMVTDDPSTGTADDATVTQVPQADLSITKTGSPNPVETGTGQLTYTLAVTNSGPSTAQNVVVTDNLPAGLTLDHTNGCAGDPSGLPTCTIGTIASGSTVNITVVANVTGSFAQFSNTATVSSTTHDPDTGDLNDTALTDTVPAAPTSLAITSATNTQVDLSWADNSIDETSFRIERSTDGSTWAEIDSVGAGVTSYSDTTLTCGNTYYYRVRAARSSAHSGYSNVVSTETDPCAPTELAQTGATASSISMAWTDNSSNETAFHVERSADGSTWTEIDTTAANVNTYMDANGLACGQTWYYQVRAERSGAFSSYSNVLTAHTLPCSLFLNGSFEINANGDFMPDDWTGKGLKLGALTDRQDCTQATEGSCSMRFVGGKKKTIFQTLTMSGPAGQHFLLSFDSMQVGAPKRGLYRVQVIVYYSKGGKKLFTINLPYSGSGWQHWTLPVTPAKNYKKIQILITYGKKSGTVWFDNVVFSPN